MFNTVPDINSSHSVKGAETRTWVWYHADKFTEKGLSELIVWNKFNFILERDNYPPLLIPLFLLECPLTFISDKNRFFCMHSIEALVVVLKMVINTSWLNILCKINAAQNQV